MNAKTISMHLLELQKAGKLFDKALRQQVTSFLDQNAAKIEAKNLVFCLHSLFSTKRMDESLDFTKF